jgi:hypothetical protein
MPREARWRLDSQWSVPEAVAEPWAALLRDEMPAVAGIVRTTVLVEHYPDEFDGDADVWQLDIRAIVEAASPEEAARTADRAVDAAMSRFRLQRGHEFGWTKTGWAVAPAEE